jgi:hypothetical protein
MVVHEQYKNGKKISSKLHNYNIARGIREIGRFFKQNICVSANIISIYGFFLRSNNIYGHVFTFLSIIKNRRLNFHDRQCGTNFHWTRAFVSQVPITQLYFQYIYWQKYIAPRNWNTYDNRMLLFISVSFYRCGSTKRQQEKIYLTICSFHVCHAVNHRLAK